MSVGVVPGNGHARGRSRFGLVVIVIEVSGYSGELDSGTGRRRVLTARDSRW